MEFFYPAGAGKLGAITFECLKLSLNMHIQIENELIRASINPLGAELTSLQHKKLQQEYMWQADPAFWSKHSPVLFPIVGTLKDNTYLFEGKAYQMGRHGFARERLFEIKQVRRESVSFVLRPDEAIKKIYPFDFEFSIHYSIAGSSLEVEYEITNTGSEELYFSVGGHPAFKVPIDDDLQYEDYFLRFERNENAPRWPISQDGLIESTPIPALINQNILPLSKELFSKDALVFKNISSEKIWLESNKSQRSLCFTFKDFPFLGLWAARNADFICIEPWCGIADPVHSTQHLTKKEGINRLSPLHQFNRAWSVELF